MEKASRLSPCYCYDPEEVVFENPLFAKPIQAKEAYTIGLRDALFALGLSPNVSWLRSMSCLIHEEPLGTFMALLVGANLVLASEKALAIKPTILDSCDVVGISSFFSEWLMRQEETFLKKVKLLYRNPLDSDIYSWEKLEEKMALKKIPICDLVAEAGRGFIFFSQPLAEKKNFSLYPSLGCAWSLTHISESGAPSVESFGIFFT